jgi:hypothetical protein
LIYVDSTAIRQIEYDELSQELIIAFSNGRTYKYVDVPRETYVEFVDADSHGEFFNAYIKDHFRYAEI